MRCRHEIYVVRAGILQPFKHVGKLPRRKQCTLSPRYIVVLTIHALEIAPAEKYRTASARPRYRRLLPKMQGSTGYFQSVLTAVSRSFYSVRKAMSRATITKFHSQIIPHIRAYANNAKEKLFIVLSYLPKATVQASIGAIALSEGLPCGKIILTAASGKRKYLCR